MPTLQGKGNKLIIYGALWCPDTLRSLEFLSKNKIEYEFRDIDKNQEYIDYVESVNHGLRIIPTIVLPKGTILTEPSNSQLSKNLKLD
jgi:glutaredoxin